MSGEGVLLFSDSESRGQSKCAAKSPKQKETGNPVKADKQRKWEPGELM